MENARETIQNIKDNLHQRSVSHKDEVVVMRAMLNDREYNVDVYKKDGTVSVYNPSQDIRKTFTNIVSNVTKLSNAEAEELVNNYEFTKSDAESMIKLSKEFVNSYLPTGRKLSLGGRANSNIELLWKDIEAKNASIPNRDGKRATTFVPAHGGIRVFNPCPVWVNKK